MSLAPDTIEADAGRAAERLAEAKASIAQAIVGQHDVVELSLAAILSGGHALLVGAPGLAKTRLVRALAVALGLDHNRVQFTPDLVPSDILGSEVVDQTSEGRREFRFIRGPVFCQLLLADEINRAPPKVQSALLQAMQEGEATVAGATHALPQPFHVLATQNPIEFEGTYPLPEAQLDRFLFEIDVDFPSRDEERAILLATTGAEEADARPVLSPGELRELQRLVRHMPVGAKTFDAILDVVRLARPSDTKLDIVRDSLEWGAGPRAGQALMLGVRARALLNGQLAPSVDDVKALARPVLKHRISLSFAARADGVTTDALIERIVEEIA